MTGRLWDQDPCTCSSSARRLFIRLFRVIHPHSQPQSSENHNERPQHASSSDGSLNLNRRQFVAGQWITKSREATTSLIRQPESSETSGNTSMRSVQVVCASKIQLDDESDSWSRRKMRCTGKLPCAHCVKMEKECTYNAKYTRGAAPNIPVESTPDGEQAKYLAQCDWPAGHHPLHPRSRSSSEQVTNAAGHATVVEVEERLHKIQRASDTFATPGFASHDHRIPGQILPHRSPPQRPGPFDSHPTYQDDPTSGASLFERTEKNMAQRYNQEKTSVLMYGDPPFQEVDSSFFVLPTTELARSMVQRYFNCVAGTNRFLHAPTVESWTTSWLNSFGNISRDTGNNAQRAVVLMVFASTHEHMFGGSERKDTDLR